MDLRQLIDAIFLAKAGDVAQMQESIQNSLSRFDVDSATDRLFFINGRGHLIGLPSLPGTSSTATTGVPTNSIQGFAPGALFINFKGSAGTLLYVNTGTFASSTWVNII